MHNKLPQWFRYVLPFLSGRQNTADFEAWLYSPDAETALPEDVYQAFLWADYRQNRENICRHLAENLAKNTYGLLFDLAYFFHVSPSQLAALWLNMDFLPVPPDYYADLEHYLSAWDSWFLNAEDWREPPPPRTRLIQDFLSQQLETYHTELLNALMHHQTLPPIPQIPDFNLPENLLLLGTTMLAHQSFTLPNGAVAPNRLLKAAMNEQLATPDCRPTEALVRLYERWADGGAGVLITGNVMIDRTALTNAGAVALENDADLPMLQRWAQAATRHGALALMQLNHPGKQSPKDLSPEPVAPSAVPLTGNVAAFFHPPRELAENEIADLIRRFGEAAAVAERAGFSGVQIHAAHGYLISQFLSPHHNRRNDQWGGSLANRMRFLLEIYREIRRRTAPEFVVSVKLNSADFQKGGFSEEDSLQVAQALANEGVDLLELSGGNYEAPAMMGAVKASTRRREAYFLDYAAEVRASCQVPLAVTGGFRSAAGIGEALSSGDTDFVGIGKPFSLLPDLPKQLFSGSFERVDTPPVRSGIAKLDQSVGGMLDMQWYIRQMHLLAQGKTPQPKLCAWTVLARMLWQQGAAAFRKERA